MLPRTIYKKVLKSVEFYRKQHEEDRRDNPNAVPAEWGTPIEESIKRHMREARLRCTDGDIHSTMEYLVSKGLLMKSPYGGYMFPTDEKLPTKEELIEQTMKTLERRK